MDEPAPSYEEAIRQRDWLEIAAPYIDIRDYAPLSRVSQRFYAIFAIRLWKDPLTTLRELRRSTSIEAHGYSYFVDCMERGVRESTASMVAVMDFRVLAMRLNGLALNNLNNDTLAEIPARFPNLRCLLLDNYSGLDPSMLARNRVLSRNPHSSLENLHLLSLANCGLPLPARISVDRWLIGLVYLDLSDTPGSLQSQIDQRSLRVINLPQLRILKLSGKNLDYTAASAVIREFRTRLWSLDVSSNNLGDTFLNDLTEFSFPTYSNIKLQTPNHFEVEGKIRSIGDNSGYSNSPFYFIEESAWSATFTCPERYLADTPVYSLQTADSADNERTSTLRTRSNGRGRPRGDSAADITRVLAGGPGERIPDAPHLRSSPHWPPSQAGTTHLHLNNLLVSASAVKHLLRYSPGFIEHFECDNPICLSNQRSELMRMAPWLSKLTILYGLPGAAHLFRPIISSNLRVLKIHHSVVTNTPTIYSRGPDMLAKLWLAETCLRERIDLAYPQTYVPDMNPRLYSLTLCMIPRYSAGAVTERLINFLKLAARQEQMIEKVRAAMPPRGPPVLEGLRHICLEFAPDVRDELVGLEDDDDDGPSAGALLSGGVQAFSFFSESAWDPSSPSAKSEAKEQPPVVPDPTRPPGTPIPPQRLDCFPFDRSEGDHVYMDIRPPATTTTTTTDANGPGQEQQRQRQRRLTVPVWIGPGTIGPANTPAVNEYMRNLCRDPANANGVIAATPCHVVAGVPAGSLIFHRAWDAMLSPVTTAGAGAGAAGAIITPPGRAALRGGMRDVVDELKAFRRRACEGYAAMEARRRERGAPWIDGEHEFWRGSLEVALPPGRAQSSEYWH